jgi:hypothetical protein
MDPQQLGLIRFDSESIAVMMCIDSDIPKAQTLSAIHPTFSLLYKDGTGAIIFTRAWPRSHDKQITLCPYNLKFSTGNTLEDCAPAQLEAIRLTRIELAQQGRRLVGRWPHYDGRVGQLGMGPYPPVNIDAYVCDTWAGFKKWADQQSANDFALFRGQRTNKWHLETSLHRLKLFDMPRYLNNRLRPFMERVQPYFEETFDLGRDLMRLCALAQHYGHATPLLDWSHSPFVAAYFAFSDVLKDEKKSSDSTHVRIFALARKFAYRPQTVPLVIGPTVTVIKTKPVEFNVRLRAQQGEFLFTNVANVESYIRSEEQFFKETYLVAIDLPIAIAGEAMSDLQSMNISYETMFPVGPADRFVAPPPIKLI